MVAGVAIGIVVVLLAGAVAAAPSNLSVNPAFGQFPALSVFSHAGVVNRGVSGTYGSASVYSHAWAISVGPNTTTPSFPVLAGSAVYLFVGYVNNEIGGGYVLSINDSFGDSYATVLSTGYDQNHTEDLYVAEPIPQTADLQVSVTFTGGGTTMGGSVAAVDVQTQVGVPTVDAVYAQGGTGGPNASVNVTTTHPNDLLLLGVSGPEKDAPFSPTTGETLLDTAGNTSGPWMDGEGFGTFSASEHGMTAELSATFATAVEWAAIGVGIYGFAESGATGITQTPSFTVLAGSVVYLFVGFVNPEIGGGTISSITDNLRDTYTLVATTDYLQNHTQELFATNPIARSASLRVTVSFAGGDTTMGGSVAAVDVVAISGTPAVDAVAVGSGYWSGTASAALTTTYSGDLLLLGVSGMGRDAPFTSAAGETLLNTGTNTSGPWEDGTGYGAFAALESGKSAALSATLATPAEWTAIGVGIHAVHGSNVLGVVSGDARSLEVRMLAVVVARLR